MSDASTRPIRSLVCRSNRPLGVCGKGVPALSSGSIPQRASAAVTRRVSVRSGEISAAVTPSCAALRRRSAIANASSRAEGASSKVTSRAAVSSPFRFGPSSSQLSVTGAGRRASEISALRSGAQGRSVSVQFGTSPGVRCRFLSKAWKRYCGWSSLVKGSSSSAHRWLGMSRSKPGRINAPWGRCAAASINMRVVPRDPVEPAMISGCLGGVSRHVPIRPSTAARCRASASGGASGPKYWMTRSRNR